MNRSDEINKLATALAKAQGAMDHATKDRANPHFKSRYADLASVVDACRAPLSANGIAVLQPARVTESAVEVDTLLVHASGQWVGETLTASVADAKAQTIGSAITYLRRYGLAAMVGVAPDDDDGNAASRSAPRLAEPEPRQQPVDSHRAEAKEAQAKCLRDFPAHAREINAAYDAGIDGAEALTFLRRLYTRLKMEAGAKPVLVQRSAAEQAQIKRARDMVQVLERDKLAYAAKLARQTIEEYGGLDGVANADLGAMVSEVEAIANQALAGQAA